jgi:hypothetical protein
MPKKEAPFGEGPKRALEETLKLAERYGFQTDLYHTNVDFFSLIERVALTSQNLLVLRLNDQ